MSFTINNTNVFPIVIPDATATDSGVVTLGQVPRFTDVDTTIYVSVDGSDSNPGTEDAPLATPDAAFVLIPDFWSKSMVIQFGIGTFTFSGKLISIGSQVGVGSSPLQILGVPVGVEDAASNLLGTMTATGGTNNTTVIAATAATTDGAYRGAFLRNITTGARVQVVDNTFSAAHTTFTVLETNGAFTAAATNRFTVEIPGTIWQADPDQIIDMHPIGQIGFGMRDIKIQDNSLTSVGAAPLFAPFGFNFMEAVQIDGGDFLRNVDVLHGSRLNARSESLFWRDAPVNPFNDNHSFAGVYLSNCGLFITDRCSADIVFCSDVLLLDCEINSSVNIASIDANFSSIQCGNFASLSINFGSVYDAIPAFPAALMGFDHADMQIGFSQEAGIDFSDNPNDAAILVDYSSTLDIGNVTGTGNGGVGISVQHCSQAIVNSNATTTSVTGTIGDMSIGAVTKTYGALPYTEATDPTDATTCTLNRAQAD